MPLIAWFGYFETAPWNLNNYFFILLNWRRFISSIIQYFFAVGKESGGIFTAIN